MVLHKKNNIEVLRATLLDVFLCVLAFSYVLMFGFGLVFVRKAFALTPAFSTLFNWIPSFFSCYGQFSDVGMKTAS
jgi:hypothetical protein